MLFFICLDCGSEDINADLTCNVCGSDAIYLDFVDDAEYAVLEPEPVLDDEYYE